MLLCQGNSCVSLLLSNSFPELCVGHWETFILRAVRHGLPRELRELLSVEVLKNHVDAAHVRISGHGGGGCWTR